MSEEKKRPYWLDEDDDGRTIVDMSGVRRRNLLFPQRFEDEGTFEQVRMRQAEFGRISVDISRIDEVDVDGPCAPMLVPHAAEGLLDGLSLVQQRFGGEGRFELDGAVEERRLVRLSPRGRLIKRGRCQEARPREPREAPDGFAERRCSAAEVGADGEADIHAF